MLIGKRIFVLESTGVISQAPLAELMTFGQDVSAEARTPLHPATMKIYTSSQPYGVQPFNDAGLFSRGDFIAL